MRKWLPLLLIAAVLTSCFCTYRLYHFRKHKPVEEFSRLVFMPDFLVKAMSFEFKGLVSDYLLLKLLVLHGERLLDKKAFSEREWQISFRAVQQITELDKRFWDPYLFAETTFPWEVGMVHETNALLEKAARSRNNDYRPNFFIWFNYYYFFHDAGKSAPYLEKASQQPGAPVYFKQLAARMRMYAGELQSGILFLQEMIREINNPRFKKQMERRLLALQTLFFLESAVQKYKKVNGELPNEINDLVSGGIINKMPPDPYGGEFYIMDNGRVYTTSDLSLAKKRGVEKKTN